MGILPGKTTIKPLFVTKAARTKYWADYDAIFEKYSLSVRDHWVQTALGKTHVLEYGNSGGEPVVLLHAAGCSAAEWYANLSALGRECHLFAVDMPGDAGKSTLECLPTGIEDYTETIRDIFDAFKLGKEVLIGHSIGGFFSAGFAMACPDRVKKLILLSPVATHVPIRWYLKLLLKFTGRPGTGPHAVKTLKMQAFKGFEPEPLFVNLMECVRNFCTVQMLFPYVFPNSELHKLAMPVYLILGTEEPLHSWKHSIELAKQKMPHVRITVLDNTGHTPNMERPEKTNKILLEILREPLT